MEVNAVVYYAFSINKNDYIYLYLVFSPHKMNTGGENALLKKKNATFTFLKITLQGNFRVK